MDALSRRIHCIYEWCYNQLEFKSLEKIKEVSQWDPEYNFLWKRGQQAITQSK